MAGKTERSNCKFAVRRTSDGKVVLVLELFQQMPCLQNTQIGFDLIGGVRPEVASKLADTLNEHVLDLFVALPPSLSESKAPK